MRIGPTGIGPDLRAKNRRAGNYFSSPSDSPMDKQLELFYFDRSRSLGALFDFKADTITFR